MATIEIQLPSGQTAEVELPQGADPKTYAQHAYHQLASQNRPTGSTPGALELLGQQLMRPVQTLGRELLEGGQQALSYNPPSQGSFVNKLVQGPLPQNPVTDAVGAGINSLLGVGRVLGAPVTAMAEEVGKGYGEIAGALGAPEGMRQGVELAGQLAGGLAAPQSLTTAMPKALQAGGRLAMRPAVKALQEAEARQLAAMSKNKAALDAHQEAIKAWEAKRQMGLDTQMANQAARAAALRRVSESEQELLAATQRAGAPTTTEAAYEFMNRTTPLPQIPVPGLNKAAQAIVDQLEDVPSALQPAKVGKVAEALEGTKSVGPDLAGMTASQKSLWGEFLSKLKSDVSTEPPTLDKLQQIQQGIGRMTRSTDPRVAGAARHLYEQTMRDVEAAAKTIPEARQYLQATAIARQNYAAEELADFMTAMGTRVSKTGQLLIQPEKLAQALRKGGFNGLRPEAKTEIESTLAQVFDLRKGIPEVVKPPRVGTQPKAPNLLPEELDIKKRGWTSGLGAQLVGAGVMIAAGIPWYIAKPVAIGYPRLIFRTALYPKGRALLRTLYADLPPSLGDTAKMSAIANFLRSQGEEAEVPQLATPNPQQ